MVKFGEVWSGLAEIHSVMSIIWMGHKNKHKNKHKTNKKT